METIFTIPKLYKSAKGWYLRFVVNGKEYRKTFDLNRIEDLDERELQFLKAADAVHAQLKSGYNPDKTILGIGSPNMTFLESLDFAMEKKVPNLSQKTISDYKGTVKFANEAVIKLNMQGLKISDTRRMHIKIILEQAQQLNKWSNHNYNKRLDHLKAILSELMQFDVIEINPAHGVRKLDVEDSIAHTPPTPEQAKAIRGILEPNYYNFWVYIFMEYDTGIRPAELLRLQLSQVDMVNDLITVLPRNAKNRKRYRFIGISPILKNYLLSLNFENLPKDYYLFGSFRESGKGNVGQKTDFIPAPTKLKRDTATRRWEKIIIIGAGINVSMYAIKKHGANNKLKADIPLAIISEQFGHSKEETTKIYTTQLKEINRDKMKGKSPDWY